MWKVGWCKEGLSIGEVTLTNVRAAHTGALLIPVPISSMLDRQHSAHESISVSPSVRSRKPTATIDTHFVEIFGPLTPLNDGETLDGRTYTEQPGALSGMNSRAFSIDLLN
jgi:hypothetical protein